MRFLCQHPLTSTVDFILGPELLLYSEPRTELLLLIFTMKVIFETRRARKELSAEERMWGDRAWSAGTWFCDRILPWAWNFNIFALSLHSANWRDLPQTISSLTGSLKVAPSPSLSGMFTDCLLPDQERWSNFFWLEPHLCIKEGNLLKVTYVLFISAEKKVVWMLICFTIFESKLCIDMVWDQSISQNLRTLAKTEFCITQNVRAT